MDNLNQSRQELQKIKRRQKRKRTKYIIVLLAIFALFFTAGVYVFSIWSQAKQTVSDAYEDDGRVNGSELRETPFKLEKDHFSVLFVGVDNGGIRDTSNNGLSDALILATFNKTDEKVNLVSIPRDSYVYIPSRDEYTKITHAHSYGGVGMTIETVENLFNVPVDYFVKVNFDAFVEVVDTLGGINVNVPYELKEMNSRDEQEAIHLLPGRQQLTGEEALALARTRKYDNDIERGKRQQDILKAMFKKALSLNTLFQVDDLFDVVGRNMRTNLKFDEMQTIAKYFLKDDLSINTVTMNGDDWVSDYYYYRLDEESLESTKQLLKSELDLIE